MFITFIKLNGERLDLAMVNKYYNIVNWKKYLIPHTDRIKTFLDSRGVDVFTQISDMINNANKTKQKEDVEVTGLFIAIGHKPNTEIFKNQLEMDDAGYIITKGKTTDTNLPGVFAAGDIVRGASLVVWAIRDGRDVADSIKVFLEKKEAKTAKVA